MLNEGVDSFFLLVYRSLHYRRVCLGQRNHCKPNSVHVNRSVTLLPYNRMALRKKSMYGISLHYIRLALIWSSNLYSVCYMGNVFHYHKLDDHQRTGNYMFQLWLEWFASKWQIDKAFSQVVCVVYIICVHTSIVKVQVLCTVSQYHIVPWLVNALHVIWKHQTVVNHFEVKMCTIYAV